MQNTSERSMRGGRIALSLLLVGVLWFQNSWFFAAMALMAVSLVITGATGSRRDWLTWVTMLLGFSLFAGLRAGMGTIVEENPFFLYVIRLETLGGLLPVSTVWLQENLRAGFLDAISTAVYISFFIVPQLVVVLMWWKGGPFARYVFAACGLFATALLVHFFLPTAPPWMAAEVGHIPPMDRIVIQVLNAISPSLTAGGYEASANDVAAMPSVHQGLSVLAMLALAEHNPRTRWVGWAYGVSMLFAITYLGEHYAVDGLLGGGLAWVGWRVARAPTADVSKHGTPQATEG